MKQYRLLCVLCASVAFSPFPAAADPAAQADGLAALRAAMGQPGWHARYSAGIRKTGSDPFDQKGAAARQGDLFYREARRGSEKDLSLKLFRFKGRIAIYDLHADTWLDDKQVGDPTLGKGLEDPDVAMQFLLDALTDAEDATPMRDDPDHPGKKKAEPVPSGGVPCRVYALTLDRRKLAAQVKQQSPSAGDLDWEKADVNAQMLAGGEPALPRKFTITGVIPTHGAPGQDKPGEDVKVVIEVEVRDYSTEPALAVPKGAQEVLNPPPAPPPPPDKPK